MMQLLRVEARGDQAHATGIDVEWARDGASESAAVWRADLAHSPHAEALLLRCEAGATIEMHAGAGYSHTIVMSGAGDVGLPDGTTVPYRAPSMVIFESHAMHSWHAREDSLLVVVYCDGITGR